MKSFNLYATLENGLNIDVVNRTASVIPQLKLKDYAKVKSILTRLGGEWVSHCQYFQFSKCPQLLIERVLKVGSRRLNKFHFYPTPESVFRFITKFTPLNYLGASNRGGVRVLEPSCGEASLMRQLTAYGESEGRKFVIDGYDIDPLNVIFCQEEGFNVQQADFLTVEAKPIYSLVIMNPPFNVDGFIKHIRHAQKFLEPGGIVISVVPTEWLSDFYDNDNRLWLLEQAQLDSASSLDEYDFFEAGTFNGVSIPTTVVCLRSSRKADHKLGSELYRQNSIDSFEFYMDNHGAYWDELHKLKMKDISLGVGADTIIQNVTKITRNIMQETSRETIHLVRRFEADYVIWLVKKWFPEYHYKLTSSLQEPVQLDFGSIFDEPQAA